MKIIIAFSLLVLSLSTFSQMSFQDSFSKLVSVTRPVDNNRTREPYATITIVKVHPNVSIHYFKKNDDAYMFLNHAIDKSGVVYYNAVLFPIIGMKTYVNDKPSSGAVKPYDTLDADSKEILDLTLEQIEQFGGASEYVKFLENRG